MKRRIFTIFAGLAIGISSGTASSATLTPQSFEKQMTTAVAALNAWDALYQNKEGLWYRQFVQVSLPAVDVMKSGSALRPLVGTFKAQFKVMFGKPQATREAARLETTSEEYSGGLNEYTIDYDLKFVPKGKAWAFFEGTSFTSMQKRVGSTTPVVLTPQDLAAKPGVHSQFIEVLSEPASIRKTP